MYMDGNIAYKLTSLLLVCIIIPRCETCIVHIRDQASQLEAYIYVTTYVHNRIQYKGIVPSTM